MSELQGKGRAERWDEMRGVRAGLHRAERWDEFTEAVRDLKKTPCHLLKGNFGNWSGYILNAHTSFYNYGPKHVHFSNAFLHKYKQKVAFYTHQTLNLGLAFLKSQLLGSKHPNKRALNPLLRKVPSQSHVLEWTSAGWSSLYSIYWQRLFYAGLMKWNAPITEKNKKFVQRVWPFYFILYIYHL